MKELNKIQLKDVLVLEEQEMKLINGGSGGYSGSGGTGGDGICMACEDYSSGGGMVLCTNDAEKAIAHAGETGWWCCNCQDAIDTCGSHMG